MNKKNKKIPSKPSAIEYIQQWVTFHKSSLLVILFFLLIYFFLFLVYHGKLLFTPDFGESDAYHLNISLKYLLAHSLKQFTLPFWTDQLYGGYPLFSEGQIGALYLPNIFFLFFFPFGDAYNLLMVSGLFFLSVGMYFFLHEMKVNKWLSIISSIIFTFNGTIILRLVHLNYFQTFSLTPWLFFFTLKYLKTKQIRWMAFFTFVLTQMIFAGSINIVFIVLFGYSIWLLLSLYVSKGIFKEKLQSLFTIAFFGTSALVFSLPQLLPTYLLNSLSLRKGGLNFDAVTAYPFSFNNLISYVLPYFFGDPRKGTYPPFSQNWGIFWENTPFLGITFFITLFGATILFIVKKYKSNLILPLISVFILCILFALGKYSPLYFVFNFVPFSLFRVPSRYLIIGNFFIVTFFAVILSIIWSKTKNKIIHFLLFILPVIACVEVLVFAGGYHLFVTTSQALSKPRFTSQISGRYVTEGQGTLWNETFIAHGWSTKKDINDYLFYRNFLYPDSNILFNVSSFDINTGGFRIQRNDYINDLISQQLYTATEPGKLNMSASLEKLLSVYNIGTIIASSPINTSSFSKIDEINDTKNTIYIYAKGKTKPFYIPKNVTKIQYLEDFYNAYQAGTLSPSSVYSEDIVKSMTNKNDSFIADYHFDTTHFYIKGKFNSETGLVLQKNIYPEWNVFIDGHKTKTFHVNLIQMGIIVPAGTHTITGVYENNYFRYGIVISVLFAIPFLVVLWRLKRRK